MSVRVVMLCAALLLAACTLESVKLSVTEAAPAVTVPSSKEAIRVGMSFMELPPTIPELRYVFACPDDLEIEMRWIAEDVGQAAPPHYPVASVPHTTGGPLNIAHLSRPTAGWPHGLYRLELCHEGQVFHTVRFAIEDPPQQ